MNHTREYWQVFGMGVGNVLCSRLACSTAGLDHNPKGANACVFVFTNMRHRFLSNEAKDSIQTQLEALKKTWKSRMDVPVSRIEFAGMMEDIDSLYKDTDRLHWLCEGMALYSAYEVAFNDDQIYGRVLLLATRMVLECITRRSREAFLFSGDVVMQMIQELKES